MGMYDSIFARCPKCGERLEFQSKTGPCRLQEYSLESAPIDILEGVNSTSPLACAKCGSFCRVEHEGDIRFVIQVNRPIAEEQGEVPYRRRERHGR